MAMDHRDGGGRLAAPERLPRDLGIRARYLHSELVSYFDTPILRGRVLFATDYPLLEWEPAIADVLDLPIGDRTKEEILWGNASRLFEVG